MANLVKKTGDPLTRMDAAGAGDEGDKVYVIEGMDSTTLD